MSPAIADDFMPLAGDRAFADDPAIIGGLARIDGRRVMLIGHEKGDDTASRLKHNFGMAKPEGYRKAIRLMQLADRFGLPVVSLVDTSGAFPGVQAEERGQAEAIARSTEQCLAMGVPMIAAVVGEGGSGGAVAIAAANRVLMFEHAVYSVISPEGCASILWRTADKAADAAEAMRVTAGDLQALGVVDRVVPEPLGGAHRAPAEAIGNLKTAIIEELDGLAKLDRGPDRSSSGAPSSSPSARLPQGTIAAELPVHSGEIRNWRWRLSCVRRLPCSPRPRRSLRPCRGTAQQPRYLNPRDVQEAARQHPELVAEFGGAETGPRAAYVEGVGRRVAAYSGTANAGQVYHFTTLEQRGRECLRRARRLCLHHAPADGHHERRIRAGVRRRP